MIARLLPLAFLLALGAAAASAASGATPRPAPHPACGPHTTSHAIVEPLDVDMWKAPLDADGRHELILAVDHSGNRFCYRYRWDGAEQIGSPTIHVRPGERFALRIVNDLSGPSRGASVASSAITPCKPMPMPNRPTEHWVGYLNHVIDDRRMNVTADDDTNIHLHGFEGPAAMEDVFLSTRSTPMHACEFEITVPTTQPPGTYAYHPHAHGMSDDEVAGGLDGAWIVDPSESALPAVDQHVLITRYRMPAELDDEFIPRSTPVFIAAEKHDGNTGPATPVSYDPFNPPPWPSTFPLRARGAHLDPANCRGAYADLVVTVDGAAVPAKLQVAGNATQLLRIVNGTGDSGERITLRDAAGEVQPMRVVELDGVPISGDAQHPLTHYLSLRDVMLAPMARAAVLVNVPAGQTYTLSRDSYCGGAAYFFEGRYTLVKIVGTPSDAAPSSLASTEDPVAQTPAAQLVAYARAHPKRIHRRALAFTEYIFPKRGKIPAHQGFYVTDITNRDFHEHPFWPTYAPDATVPLHPDITVKQGTIEEWYLINTTLEPHAFHIHQMAFVEEDSPMGVPVTVDTSWDPVGKLLPNPRDPKYPLVQPRITKILLDFRHVPKGEFVFHCHMLYHEDHGMMGVIRVI